MGYGDLTFIGGGGGTPGYRGSFGDGNYIYVADSFNGLKSFSVDGSGNLSFVDQDDQGKRYEFVFWDGTFIYVTLSGTDGLLTYQADGAGILTYKSTHVFTFHQDVWADGNFVYTAAMSFGIRSHTVDGNGVLTEVDDDDQGGFYSGIWGDGIYLYVAVSGTPGGILKYTVNGIGELTFIGSYFTAAGEGFRRVWGDGNYIYVACGTDGLRSFSNNGVGFTLNDTNYQGGDYDDVYGDGDFIYTANTIDGVRSHRVDGSGNLTFIDIEDEGGDYGGIWADSNFIYCGADTNFWSYEAEKSSSSSSSSISSSSLSSSSSSLSSSSSSSSLSSSSSSSSLSSSSLSSSSSSLSSSSSSSSSSLSSSSSSSSLSSSSSSTSLALPTLKHFWYSLRDRQGVPRVGEEVTVFVHVDKTDTVVLAELYDKVGLQISNPVTTSTATSAFDGGIFEFYLKDEMWNNVDPLGYEWDDRIKLEWDDDGGVKSADRIMTWGDFHPIYDTPFDPQDWSQIDDPTGDADVNDKNKAISNSLAYQIECHISKQLEGDLESSSSLSSSSSSSTSSSSSSSSVSSSSISSSSSSSLSSSSSSVSSSSSSSSESSSSSSTSLAAFAVRIATGADDGQSNVNGSGWINSNVSVNMGNRQGASNRGWFRFSSVTIPKDTVISSAILRFVSNLSGPNNTFRTNIRIEDADNPTAPTGSGDLLGRPLGASIPWDGEQIWSDGNTYDSDDFSSILETHFARAGWNTGQALTVHIINDASSNNTHRDAKAYDLSTTLCAELRVSYAV